MARILENAVPTSAVEKTDRPRSDLGLLAILVGIVIVALVIFIRRCRYPGIDDAFITYRYARNLAAGLGWVYNPGERVQGASTPLFTAWLAIASKTSVAIPLISRATSAVAMCATLVVVFLWLRRIQSTFAGLVAVVFLLASSYLDIAASGNGDGDLYPVHRVGVLLFCAGTAGSRFCHGWPLHVDAA